MKHEQQRFSLRKYKFGLASALLGIAVASQSSGVVAADSQATYEVHHEDYDNLTTSQQARIIEAEVDPHQLVDGVYTLVYQDDMGQVFANQKLPATGSQSTQFYQLLLSGVVMATGFIILKRSKTLKYSVIASLVIGGFTYSTTVLALPQLSIVEFVVAQDVRAKDFEGYRYLGYFVDEHQTVTPLVFEPRPVSQTPWLPQVPVSDTSGPEFRSHLVSAVVPDGAAPITEPIWASLASSTSASTAESTVALSSAPTVIPTTVPSSEPTLAPTADPTAAPSSAPTVAPTTVSSSEPTSSPIAAPTIAPTSAPTVSPTTVPSSESTPSPTAEPTAAPSSAPTVSPTTVPSSAPTSAPIAASTVVPTSVPTVIPTSIPTTKPTAAPSSAPTVAPTTVPSSAPTSALSAVPTVAPTSVPTVSPTTVPSSEPTPSPTSEPTIVPTSVPTVSPTTVPSSAPTSVPIAAPTVGPTSVPTVSPTIVPSSAPTSAPSVAPTAVPSSVPTVAPTTVPSSAPTPSPTAAPTIAPSSAPTVAPTAAPSSAPTVTPTTVPSSAPTPSPTAEPTAVPSSVPTVIPTSIPTTKPTVVPSLAPTVAPTTVPSSAPTSSPTSAPTVIPSLAPTVAPTTVPSSAPTPSPTSEPTIAPTSVPTAAPRVLDAQVAVTQLDQDFVIDVTALQNYITLTGTVTLPELYNKYLNDQRVQAINILVGDEIFTTTLSQGAEAGTKTLTAKISATKWQTLQGQPIHFQVHTDPYLFELEPDNGKQWIALYGGRLHEKPEITDLTLAASPFVNGTAGNYTVAYTADEVMTSLTGQVSGASVQVGDSLFVQIGSQTYETQVAADQTFSLEMKVEDLLANASHQVQVELVTADGKVSTQADYIAPVWTEARGETLLVPRGSLAAEDLPYWLRSVQVETTDFLANYEAPGHLSQSPIGESRTLYYHFMSPEETSAAIEDDFDAVAFTEEDKAVIVKVFNEIESKTGLKFVESATRVASDQGVNIYMDDIEKGGGKSNATTLGYAVYGGDLHINKHLYASSVNAENSLAGKNGFTVAIHELLHSFGLKHPFEADTESPEILNADEERALLTIMTYQHDAYANKDSLRPIDLAYLHYRYGVNRQARSGNDTYTFKSFNQGTSDADVYIWDGAGVDTFDARDQDQGVYVNLTPGSWIYSGSKSQRFFISDSQVVSAGTYFNLSETDLTGNIGIYNQFAALNPQVTYTQGQAFIGFDTQIENLYGSKYDDILVGNAADNIIYGGDGDDQIAGGQGANFLSGGAGANIFSFETALDGKVTTIADFKTGIDKIQLSQQVFSQLNERLEGFGSLLHYDQETGDLRYDGQRFATLANRARLTQSDFILTTAGVIPLEALDYSSGDTVTRAATVDHDDHFHPLIAADSGLSLEVASSSVPEDTLDQPEQFDVVATEIAPRSDQTTSYSDTPLDFPVSLVEPADQVEVQAPEDNEVSETKVALSTAALAQQALAKQALATPAAQTALLTVHLGDESFDVTLTESGHYHFTCDSQTFLQAGGVLSLQLGEDVVEVMVDFASETLAQGGQLTFSGHRDQLDQVVTDWVAQADQAESDLADASTAASVSASLSASTVASSTSVDDQATSATESLVALAPSLAATEEAASSSVSATVAPSLDQKQAQSALLAPLADVPAASLDPFPTQAPQQASSFVEAQPAFPAPALVADQLGSVATPAPTDWSDAGLAVVTVSGSASASAVAETAQAPAATWETEASAPVVQHSQLLSP